MESENSVLFLTKQEEEKPRTYPCGADLDSWYPFHDPNMLILTGSGAMWDYGKNVPPWWECRDEIRTLSIDKRVTKIGARAFEGLKISTVSLSQMQLEIGNYAFADCDELNVVALSIKPGSKIRIGKGAFENCRNIRHVIISKNSEISVDAFPEGTRIIRV